MEDQETPRSGRGKKKSALAKLAAKRGKAANGDDASVGEMSDQVISRSRPQYPLEADVEEIRPRDRPSRNPRQRLQPLGLQMSDTDEGIEMGSSTYDASVGSPPHGRIVTGETMDAADGLRMNKDESIINSYRRTPQPKPRLIGEKRIRDHYSSGEEDGMKAHSSKMPNTNGEVITPRRNISKTDTGSYSVQNEPKYPRSRITPSNSDLDLNTTSPPSASLSHRGLNPLPKPRNLPDAYHLEKMDDLCIKDDNMASSMDQKAINKQYRRILSEEGAGSNGVHEHVSDIDEMVDQPMPLKSDLPTRRPLNKHLTSSSLGSSIFSSQEQWTAKFEKLTQFDSMSQHSTSTASALPAITTKEARNRSFLMGSMNGRTSLLGADELQRYFPDRKVRMFMGTWNMCEIKSPPASIDDFLLPDHSDYVQDVYIIATQESMANRKEWETKIQECLGPQHVLFHSAAHGVLYLSVYIRRDLVWYCSVAEESSVSTRAGPSGVKTKGAIAVSFILFGTSFLLINSHLTPHDGKAKERCADFKKICSELDLPREVFHGEHVKKQDDVTSRFDVVFWAGDLNFRIEKERDRVHQKVKAIESQDIPSFEDLMENDELYRVRNQGVAFQHFQEGRINFKPTYKYDCNSDEYDTKKMRIPSYTDRVLFRTKKKNSAVCLHYSSVDSIKESDHRPVFALFEVLLRPGRDNIPLNAGLFDRGVYLEGNSRRAAHLEAKGKKGKASKVCRIQ